MCGIAHKSRCEYNASRNVVLYSELFIFYIDIDIVYRGHVMKRIVITIGHVVSKLHQSLYCKKYERIGAILYKFPSIVTIHVYTCSINEQNILHYAHIFLDL